MKKFLTVSMMALAMVLASSCNKDEDPAKDVNNTKYINTWVAKDVEVGKILGDVSDPETFVKLPDNIKSQLADMKLDIVVKLDENGKGNAGVHLDNNKLTMLRTIFSWISQQEGVQIPSEVSQIFAGIKADDYVGAPFAYSAAPTDETKGKFTVTVGTGEESETEDVNYSDLSDNAMTLSYKDEVENPQTGKTEMVDVSYTLKSLGSTGLTVNNFVDVSALAALIPDGGDETDKE